MSYIITATITTTVKAMILWVVLVGLSQVVNIQSAGVQGSRTLSYAYFARDDCVCLGCGPGEFVSKHCVKCGKKSSCRDCPPDTFSTTAGGATTCQHCHICNSGVNKVKDCTSVSDTECRCPNGTDPLVPDGKIILCASREQSTLSEINSTVNKPNGGKIPMLAIIVPVFSALILLYVVICAAGAAIMFLTRFCSRHQAEDKIELIHL